MIENKYFFGNTYFVLASKRVFDLIGAQTKTGNLVICCHHAVT